MDSLCWGGGEARFFTVGGLSTLGLTGGLSGGLGDLCTQGTLGWAGL